MRASSHRSGTSINGRSRRAELLCLPNLSGAREGVKRQQDKVLQMFGQATRDAILERLADGEALRAICRSEGMPAKDTVLRWLDEDEAFRSQYAQARDKGFDERAERIKADIQAEPDVARARLIFDAERWYLGKMKAKYSERAVISGDAENPVAVSLEVKFR